MRWFGPARVRILVFAVRERVHERDIRRVGHVDQPVQERLVPVPARAVTGGGVLKSIRTKTHSCCCGQHDNIRSTTFDFVSRFGRFPLTAPVWTLLNEAGVLGSLERGAYCPPGVPQYVETALRPTPMIHCMSIDPSMSVRNDALLNPTYLSSSRLA